MYAIVTKSQAEEIANFIAISVDGQIASNSNYSATSTRITSIFHEFENDTKRGLLEVYSNYTRENVVDELPEQYQDLDFFELDKNELDVYLHNN